MSIFSKVPDAYNVKVNKFKLNEEFLTTGEIGKLYPVYNRIFMPNSYVKISPACVAKTAPMFAPIYSSYNVNFYAFAVPLRLLWRKFYDWIYDPENNDDAPPHISAGTYLDALTTMKNHPLMQDLGFPVDHEIDPNDNSSFTVWPFLAYHKIYNDFFRNENIEDEISYIADDEVQDYDLIFENDGDYAPMLKHHNVNYRKDYFTSALPWAQKGQQALLSVLAQDAARVNFVVAPQSQITSNLYYAPTFLNGQTGDTTVGMRPADRFYVDGSQFTAGKVTNNELQEGHLEANLTEVGRGLSASDFRALFAVQSYLEQLAVGGSRYIEGTLSFYNTRIKDSRAQRPEYLGMMRTTINPREVVAHDGNDLGKLGAFGGGASTGSTFRYYCSEHTIIMVVMSITTNSLYYQGISKELRLLDQFDYPLPMFQHLGEEEIKNGELYYTGVNETDNGTFGYQSRFAYWRSSRNRLGGDFAYNSSGTLDRWHLARQFNTTPQLTKEFIEISNEDTWQESSLNRVFNYDLKDVDHFWISMFFDVTAKLPFRYHSKPMLIG